MKAIVTRNVFKMLKQKIKIEGLYNHMRRLKLCKIRSFHFEEVQISISFLLYMCMIMLCMLNLAF